MTKITIIGAGSAFTQEIAVDILNIEGVEGGTIALVDIDATGWKLPGSSFSKSSK